MNTEIRTMIAIVTHSDLDGLAAAALYTVLSNIEIDNVHVVLSGPSQLHKDLQKLVGEDIDKVVIIDIGINTANYNDVLKVLRDLRERSVEIEWFDHHVWEAVWVEEIGKVATLVVDRSTCATGVVFKSLHRTGNRKEISDIERFVAAVCAVDLWKFDRWEAPFLLRFVEYRDDYEWYSYVYKMFVSSLRMGGIDEIINKVSNVVEEYMDKELRVLSTLCSKSIVKELNGIRIGVYVRRSNIPNASIVGNAMLSICRLDIAAVVNPDLSRLSLRSQRCNVREIAFFLGGGGHPRAAGTSIRVSPLLRFLWKAGIARDAIARLVSKKVLDLIEGFAEVRGRVCIELHT